MLPLQAAVLGLGLMCCNVCLTRACRFYHIQTPNSFSLSQSPSCPLLILFNSLSQSLSINRGDKPQHICLKPLPGWWSHRNDTYSLSFQTTLMAYWRACRLTDYLCLCVHAGWGVHSHISVYFNPQSFWVSFIIPDHSEGISTCPFPSRLKTNIH